MVFSVALLHLSGPSLRIHLPTAAVLSVRPPTKAWNDSPTFYSPFFSSP